MVLVHNYALAVFFFVVAILTSLFQDKFVFTNLQLLTFDFQEDPQAKVPASKRFYECSCEPPFLF